jgi:hypothetical protein
MLKLHNVLLVVTIFDLTFHSLTVTVRTTPGVTLTDSTYCSYGICVLYMDLGTNIKFCLTEH